MTKRELIEALQANTMPDDCYVAISLKDANDGPLDSARWFDIAFVETSAQAEPLLIGVGECIME